MRALKRNLGAALTSVSLSLLIVSYSPVVSSELPSVPPEPRATQKVVRKNRFYLENPTREEARSLGVDANFSVVIPKIGVSEPVLGGVDPINKDEYLDKILKGVAHAAGTDTPDGQSVTYLFAHSTNSIVYFEQFNAVFFRLNELEQGDEIIVFYDGNRYAYEVAHKQVVNVDDTYWINNPKSEGRKLVVQTSHPPGTTWKRLLVVANPK